MNDAAYVKLTTNIVHVAAIRETLGVSDTSILLLFVTNPDHIFIVDSCQDPSSNLPYLSFPSSISTTVVLFGYDIQKELTLHHTPSL